MVTVMNLRNLFKKTKPCFMKRADRTPLSMIPLDDDSPDYLLGLELIRAGVYSDNPTLVDTGFGVLKNWAQTLPVK